VFTDAVLSYYVERGGLCTEGSGQQMVYYRAERQIVPERIETFLEQGLDLVGLFSGKGEAPEDIDRLDRVLEEAQSALQSLESSTGD
jgi:hypothetical protein